MEDRRRGTGSSRRPESRRNPIARLADRLFGLFIVLSIATIIHYESPEQVRTDLDWVQARFSEWSVARDRATQQPSRAPTRPATTAARSDAITTRRVPTPTPTPTTRAKPEPVIEPDYIDYIPAYTVESPPATIRVERDWTALDRAVRSLPKHESIDGLVQSIDRLTNDDWERARAVYVWLTTNVAYDTVSYFSGTRGAITPEDVFRTGTSVCQGYADLFTRLATGLGLDARTVSGYAKGYGYRSGRTFQSTNHAWNAVRIAGSWHLFDSTWGAGSVDGQRFVRQFDAFWFDPHPDLFLRSHLPSDPAWQLAVRPITKTQFEAEAYENSRSIAALWQHGFVDGDVVEALYTDRGLPEAFETAAGSVRVLNAPLSESVTPGERLTFRLRADSGTSVALINNGTWTYLTRNGDYLFGSVRPSAGVLSLNIQHGGSGESYYTAIRYKVG